jgi:proline iminopeptidase
LGRLVLVTPTGRVTREPDESEVAAIRARRADEPWHATDDEEATARLFYGTWSETARRHYETSYVDPPSWLREEYYLGAAGPAATHRLARLAAVPNPVLAVAGELDGMIGTVPAHLIADCYPAGRLEILPGCGHWPWIDAPARFTSLVNDFLTT